MAVPQDILSAQKCRYTISELERLVALRDQFLDASIDVSSIGKVILKKIETIESSHVISTKAECFHDIVRLGEIRIRIRGGTRSWRRCKDENHHVLESHLQDGGVLDELIKVKLESFIRVCEDDSETERVFFLERLAELAIRISDSKIHSVIEDTIKTLTESMFLTPSPPVRAVSISSDESDSRIIFSPDDDGSTSSVGDDSERALKDQVENLQRDLRRATSDIAELSKEVDIRDVQIGRLTARVASSAPHTSDLPEQDETKKAVPQDVKGLVADNARLTEELASARKALGQIDSISRTRREPYQSPPPLPKSDFNIEVPLVAERMAWPGPLPTRPAERSEIRPITHARRNFGRPPVRNQPTRTVNRFSESPFPQFPPELNGNYTTPNWTFSDIPTHSAWPAPNAARHKPWDERSACDSWGGLSGE